MEKIAGLINHYYDQIHNRVEGILVETTNSKEFTPSQNINAFARWAAGLEGSLTERSIKCFAGLSVFFDAGALILRDQDRGVVQHLFLDGELLAPEDQDSPKSIDLPSLEAFQIKKHKGTELYRGLFPQQNAKEDCEALLIGTPSPFAYLTFSNLPHPWLLERMEHLQSCLKESLN